VNIFILDESPKICAKYHCDKHVIKMILESAQMMSAVIRLEGHDTGYKLTHENHPCTVWARKSQSNYLWLFALACDLNAEYKYRYDKIDNHKSYELIKTLPMPFLPDIGLTPFVQAMPDCYKNSDAVTAYRNYYINEKTELLHWKKRPVPEWASQVHIGGNHDL
jgi:hypothetical protein